MLKVDFMGSIQGKLKLKYFALASLAVQCMALSALAVDPPSCSTLPQDLTTQGNLSSCLYWVPTGNYNDHWAEVAASQSNSIEVQLFEGPISEANRRRLSSDPVYIRFVRHNTGNRRSPHEELGRMTREDYEFNVSNLRVGENPSFWTSFLTGYRPHQVHRTETSIGQSMGAVYVSGLVVADIAAYSVFRLALSNRFNPTGIGMITRLVGNSSVGSGRLAQVREFFHRPVSGAPVFIEFMAFSTVAVLVHNRLGRWAQNSFNTPYNPAMIFAENVSSTMNSSLSCVRDVNSCHLSQFASSVVEGTRAAVGTQTFLNATDTVATAQQGQASNPQADQNAARQALQQANDRANAVIQGAQQIANASTQNEMPANPNAAIVLRRPLRHSNLGELEQSFRAFFRPSWHAINSTRLPCADSFRGDVCFRKQLQNNSSRTAPSAIINSLQ